IGASSRRLSYFEVYSTVGSLRENTADDIHAHRLNLRLDPASQSADLRLDVTEAKDPSHHSYIRRSVGNLYEIQLLFRRKACACSARFFCKGSSLRSDERLTPPPLTA